MKKQNVRTLSLVVGTFTYLLIGAAVFDALESENEIAQRDEVGEVTKILTAKYNISNDDFEELERTIVSFVPHSTGYQWHFSGAFFFSTTVITTIGYGHSTPSTIGGKSFCMLYALFGIPLGLIMFHTIGERLNSFIAWVLANVKRHIFRRDRRKTVGDLVNHTELVCLTFFVGAMITTLGAMVFSLYEQWSYWLSIYYCFVTLTTIGFGDYVALQKPNDLQNHPEYVTFNLFFILFGLTVLSASMNLLVLRFLTLNTLDEKRDERAALLAQARGVRVEGDIITGGGGGGLVDGNISANITVNDACTSPDAASVCSCSCYQLPYTGITQIRSPRPGLTAAAITSASAARLAATDADLDERTHRSRSSRVDDTSQIIANVDVVAHPALASPRSPAVTKSISQHFQRSQSPYREERTASEMSNFSMRIVEGDEDDDFDANTIIL